MAQQKMSTHYRPRRSVLYMPSSNQRALEKAKDIPCDAIIFDLEDAVAPDAKEGARESACAAVQSGEYGRRELIIRINGIGTGWHASDLQAAAKACPDAILVPKVNHGSDVRLLANAMRDAGAQPKTTLWAMVETPIAMLSAWEIASASDRLTTLVMGTNDLNKELGAIATPDRGPLMTGLGMCLLAARAAGRFIIDGVYNDVKNIDGFKLECRQGREMGFDGKTLIHPGQVDVCNEAYAPTAEDVEDARGVITAFEEASASGRGVATYKGRQVENLHVYSARKMLAVDDAIKHLEADRR